MTAAWRGARHPGPDYPGIAWQEGGEDGDDPFPSVGLAVKLDSAALDRWRRALQGPVDSLG